MYRGIPLIAKDRGDEWGTEIRNRVAVYGWVGSAGIS